MKTAFVLSGGGAKGAFQVGVMKRLAEQGILPDVIYGTSVGALNAAGYAYGGMEGLEQQWLGITGPVWYKPWTPSPDVLGFNWGLLFFGWSDGIYNTKPLQAHLKQVCVGTPRCEAVAVRVSLNTGIVDYVSNKDVTPLEFVEAVRASSTIPGMMSPVGEWVDGGVRQVAAVAKALADGADRIYVILCNPLAENPTELYDTAKAFPLFKFLNVAYRSIDGVMEHEIFVSNTRECFKNDTGTAMEIYAPVVIPCSTLEFDPKKIRSNIEMGYNTAVVEKLGAATPQPV